MKKYTKDELREKYFNILKFMSRSGKIESEKSHIGHYHDSIEWIWEVAERIIEKDSSVSIMLGYGFKAPEKGWLCTIVFGGISFEIYDYSSPKAVYACVLFYIERRG